jgi:hypothetical protein
LVLGEALKIVAVLTRTTNTRYFRHVLGVIENAGVSVDRLNLVEYIMGNHDDGDVLIYNTFPDETNRRKYPRGRIEIGDEKFRKFKGIKILLDTHDNGTKDGFERFSDLSIPRIKVNPGREISKRMNIVLSIPYIVYDIYQKPMDVRNYRLVCALKTEGRPLIRQYTLDKIRGFGPITEWLPIREHAKRLCSTLVNVVPTGWGDANLSHTDTLAAGALLFAHESINAVKILPYGDLYDGGNFLSYNEDNICDKLRWVFDNPTVLNQIRLNGLETFMKGYDVNRSADDFLGGLNEY